MRRFIAVPSAFPCHSSRFLPPQNSRKMLHTGTTSATAQITLARGGASAAHLLPAAVADTCCLLCSTPVHQAHQAQHFSSAFNKKIKREKKGRNSDTEIAALKATISNGDGGRLAEWEEDDEEMAGKEALMKGRSSSISGSLKSAKTLAADATKEMEQYFKILDTALEKHLSLKVNLKAYEDLSVTLEHGETNRLIKFARISLKTPTGPIVLNFTDNPAAIKPAKIAIQNMAENVVPQVDGIIIYVPIPKLTRERREALATHSSNMVLKEFKLALNEVYKKYTKLLGRSTSNKELIIRLCNGLLARKRQWDKQGEDKVKERRQMLLKEIEFG